MKRFLFLMVVLIGGRGFSEVPSKEAMDEEIMKNLEFFSQMEMYENYDLIKEDFQALPEEVEDEK